MRLVKNEIKSPVQTEPVYDDIPTVPCDTVGTTPEVKKKIPLFNKSRETRRLSLKGIQPEMKRVIINALHAHGRMTTFAIQDHVELTGYVTYSDNLHKVVSRALQDLYKDGMVFKCRGVKCNIWLLGC